MNNNLLAVRRCRRSGILILITIIVIILTINIFYILWATACTNTDATVINRKKHRTERLRRLTTRFRYRSTTISNTTTSLRLTSTLLMQKGKGRVVLLMMPSTSSTSTSTNADCGHEQLWHLGHVVQQRLGLSGDAVLALLVHDQVRGTERALPQRDDRLEGAGVAAALEGVLVVGGVEDGGRGIEEGGEERRRADLDELLEEDVVNLEDAGVVGVLELFYLLLLLLLLLIVLLKILTVVFLDLLLLLEF